MGAPAWSKDNNTEHLFRKAIHLTPKPLFPYVGGKRRLAKHILPLFPAHTCYCEPCSGAAAIFFMKPPSEVEVLNDINGEIVNLYRVVKCHLEEFLRQFKSALISRQIYDWLVITRPETLTDIQRAARWYYIQRNCFGGKVTGQTFGTAATAPPRMNLLRIEEELSAAHLRLSRVMVEHLDWLECIRRYDRAETLFYIDPPYWGTEGYGVDFGLEQYQMIADAALSIKGKMIVSVNDIPEMREVFAGFHIRTVDITYNVDLANAAKRQELIVTSWEA